MDSLSFYIGLTFILMHEMDAIRCHEWRIFPGLSSLNDRTGFAIFLWTHLILYVALFVFLSMEEYRDGTIHSMSIFFVVHLLAHLLFLRHPRNEFKDVHSWLLIAGAAIAGAWQLI